MESVPGELFRYQHSEPGGYFTMLRYEQSRNERQAGSAGTTFSNTVRFMPGSREWRPPYRFRLQADGDKLATVVVKPDGSVRTSLSI
ncbi:hypothetical protein [Morganella morganii]|uniref:hypothetical protein n=1 Tax=Morganella morganii TaxID=582 RepID=UPI00339CD674